SSPVLHAEGWPRSRQTETTGRCGEKAGAGSEGRGSSPALPALLWSSKGVTASTTGRSLHIPDTAKAPASRGPPRRRGRAFTRRLAALGLLGRDLLHGLLQLGPAVLGGQLLSPRGPGEGEAVDLPPVANPRHLLDPVGSDLWGGELVDADHVRRDELTTVVLVRLLVGRLVRTTAGVVLRVAERGDSDGLGELLAGGLCRESGARWRGALRRDALRLAGGVPGRAAAGHERGGCNDCERGGLQVGVH